VAPREYIAEEKKAVLTQRNKPQGENAANFVPKPKLFMIDSNFKEMHTQ
jgi:hypothetical protein